MKKIILVALMAVMVATPCFAQEVVPEGIFSVEGTLWRMCGIELTSYAPFFSMNCNKEIGFRRGQVYGDPELGGEAYMDLGVVSIAWNIYPWNYYLAIMQPSIGLGVFTFIKYKPGGCVAYHFVSLCYLPSLEYSIGIMFKTNDNLTPAGIE